MPKNYRQSKDKPRLPHYLAFLLRLRRDSESTPWRATIENPHTGERRGFAGLIQLILFLEAQTGERVMDNWENNEGGES